MSVTQSVAKEDLETKAATWISEAIAPTVNVHPAADEMPEIDETTFALFKADIAKHGVLVPIVIQHGTLIDGRHRVRAARELGIPCPSIEAKDGIDAVELVASMNLHRRHLSPDQIVARVVLLEDTLAKHTAPKPHVRSETRRVGKASVETAKKLGVSRATVERVQAVKRKAPEKIKDIAAGTTSANKIIREMKGVEKKLKVRTKTTSKPAPPAADRWTMDPEKQWQEPAILLQRFSENKPLQNGLRSVLTSARQWATTHTKHLGDFSEFFYQLSQAFLDESIAKGAK
jgi:ParB-like chromosome segregation protein Spo0J